MVAAVQNMGFVGATPWHGLGDRLERGASLPKWAKAAGMEHEILTAPVQYGTSDKMRSFPGKVVTFRSDTGAPMGVVSNNFKIVQPMQVLEFFKDEAALRGFELETAGVLFRGEKYWALARTPESFSMGKDEVRAYLLLATACNGGMATVAKYTSIRTVCNNTLELALKDSGGTVRTRHNQKFEASAVQEQLLSFSDSWKEMQETVKAISKRVVKGAEAVKVLATLFDVADKPVEEQVTGNVETIMNKFSTGSYIGSDLKSSSGTLWGLVNAVTEFVDHDRARDQSRRLDWAFFGGGAELKKKALKVAATLL